MENRNHSNTIHRHPFLFFLLILSFVSIACINDDFQCWLNGDNCPDVSAPEQNKPSTTTEIYSGTGSADITYVIAYGPPQDLTTVCHDDISDALVKVNFTQTLPADIGFTRTLNNNEFYFTAEIHSALANPWRNKQCEYATDKNDYVLFYFTGIYYYDRTDVVMTTLYEYYPECTNAAKLVKSGSSIQLT